MRSLSFSCYVFDLDGTLVDSREDLARAVNHARAALRLEPLSLETITGFVGEGVARLIDRALGPEHEDKRAEAIAHFRGHYAKHLVDHTYVYDGVTELLRSLCERGARLAVATNKPEAYARTILANLELARFFEAVVGGDSLAERKPDPMPITHLMSRFSSPRERTLMVGDSRIDHAAARAAGVAFCGVLWGIGPADELRALEPELVAAHPRDLLTAVARA